MARSRNIKPGFFTNDVLGELPALTRLLFAGIWTLCDREGRLEDRPTKIRMEVFPADNVDVETGLEALHHKGFILRYKAGGKDLIQVITWGKHQNPHVKEAPSTLPAPCEPGANPVLAPEIPERAGLIPDSLIPDSLKEPSSAAAAADPLPRDCPHEEIISLYHSTLPALIRVREWTPERQKLLRSRWREKAERQSLDWWKKFFEYVSASDFLMGRVQGRGGTFECNLEWLIRPKNLVKVIEGNYENKAA